MRGLNEPVQVQDIFCSGLGAIERLEGNCFRFHFFVTQRSGEGEREEKVVVSKLVIPAAAVPPAIMKMIDAAGEPVMAMIPGLKLLN
jgi:hypothetical protein